MALIKCPECKKSISDKSVRCPFCDFVLIDKVVTEQKVSAKKCRTHQNTFVNRALKFLRFNWLFDFIDGISYDLSDIPIVGPILYFVFNSVCALVIIAIIAGVIAVIIAGLFHVSPLLGIEAILIGATIFMYFSTDRATNRPYYFWFALVITILFPIAFAFA